MRILVAGDFRDAIYEPAFCDALRRGGAEVETLRVGDLFGRWGPWVRAQRKYVVGPGIRHANRVFVESCAVTRPDVVLGWRTPWILPGTITRAREAGARLVVLYNNDDPFGPDRGMAIWRNFRRIVPEADLCFAYRSVNLEEYRRAGARDVALLRSYFIPSLHYPPRLTDDELRRYACDVVFLGHGEDDERLDLFDAVMDIGLEVRLFGAGWAEHARGHRWARLLPIVNLRGDEYRKAVGAAKIGLVFLSRRNRDDYTRRCFEIPAIGTLMLAPRTDELLSLFREDVEAAFFGSAQELAAQALRYARDDVLRKRVADAGRRRVIADGHDVDARARDFLARVSALGSTASRPARPAARNT